MSFTGEQPKGPEMKLIIHEVNLRNLYAAMDRYSKTLKEVLDKLHEEKRLKTEGQEMEKQVIRNWHLQGMIRGFTSAVIGSGFDFAISEALQKLRPKEVEFVPISMSEAASLAAIAIAQVENREGR